MQPNLIYMLILINFKGKIFTPRCSNATVRCSWVETT
jgi:hypothetical protein